MRRSSSSPPRTFTLRHVLAAGLLGMLAAGCEYVDIFFPSLDHLFCENCIRPNDGVGPIELGMSFSDLLDEWPGPSDIEFLVTPDGTHGGKTYHARLYYPERGIKVFVHEGRVSIISMYSAGVELKPGAGVFYKAFPGKLDGVIGVNSTRVEVEKYLKGPYMGPDDVFNKRYRGIGFDYKEDGTILLILVDLNTDS